LASRKSGQGESIENRLKVAFIMENLLLEHGSATIKQTVISQSKDSHYFVITGQKEALSFKIVNENAVEDFKFKKLYSISHRNVGVSVLDTVDLSCKLLLHPSVHIVKKIKNSVQEPVQEVVEEVVKEKKKSHLTKESFFSSFKKFEKSTKNEDSQSFQLPTGKVQSGKVQTGKAKAGKAKNEVKKQVKKQVEQVSEKSMKQEADLMNMFDKDEEEKEMVVEEEVQVKKTRKKRKVLKTMTFMDGKYMSNFLYLNN
jgi:hypothetical protein